MRKLQNTNRTVSNTVVRQDNPLIVRVEALRTLHANSHSALSSIVTERALGLFRGWQNLCMSWLKPRISTGDYLITPIIDVIKQPMRQHFTMCCRAAA